MPKPKVVVLDAMGVIYLAGDDVAELLIPFARSRGCRLPDSDIAETYMEASLGQLTSTDLWRSLGVAGPSADLDADYLKGHKLTPGVRQFLGKMKAAEIPVACISNDVAEWSRALRKAHGLEDLIFQWTISGEVGARKPDAAIFQRFRSATELWFEDCVFVDDNARNLDAARALGFRTLLFGRPKTPDGASQHVLALSFEELEAWLLAEP